MSPRHSRPFPTATAACIAAFLLAPVTVRLTLTAEHEFRLGLGDLRGWLGEVAISVLLTAAVAAVTNARPALRSAALVVLTVWSLAHWANYEHIAELGSVINFLNVAYIADPTFLLGSALSPSHPALLAMTVIGSIALAWAGLTAARPAGVGRWATAAAALLWLVLAVLPRSTEISQWRQGELVGLQLGRLARRAAAGAPESDGETALVLERDLSGTPIIDLDPRPRNVLLIILEGVSGAFVPSLRQHHGASSPVTMPALDRVAARGLAYPSFIATQRQTNRGEYAILCADSPTLISAEAKMTRLADAGRPGCLPEVLRAAGFTTIYLQASPLPFMLKDRFMPRIGFDRVMGNASIERAYNRNHWGVDDRAFFEAALELIDELQHGERPWFLTLLTVGTHHRYNVPPDFSGDAEPGTTAWAFEYLDRAVAELVTGLEGAGVLDNTLVLFTSDESQAMEVGASDARNALTQGWGFLVALTPSGRTGTVPEMFAQPDIALSILDALGLADTAPTMPGRSVFRHYDRPRDLFWGNTHLGLVAGLSRSWQLTVCTEDLGACGAARLDPDAVFAPNVAFGPAPATEVERLRSAVRASLVAAGAGREARVFDLVSADRQLVLPGGGEQYVFGGQFIEVPPHSRIDVDLEIELIGDEGSVDFVHNLLAAKRPLLGWSETLPAGQRLRLSYTIGAEGGLSELECRFWLTGCSGDGLALEIHTSRLSVTPLPAGEAVPETKVHRREIVP